MRKKTISLLMASLFAFGIVGCGTANTDSDATTDEVTPVSLTGTQKAVVVGDDW